MTYDGKFVHDIQILSQILRIYVICIFHFLYIYLSEEKKIWWQNLRISSKDQAVFILKKSVPS